MSGRRIAWVVGGLVLAFACALGTASPAWASNKSATKAQNLAPELLTISQMPVGWSVDTSPPNTSCLTVPFNGVAGKARTEYQASGGVPSLSEILIPGGASKYTSVKKSLDACHTFTISTPSSSVTATMSALSFPPVGQSSAAYGVSFTVDGVNGAEDVVLAMKGSTVMGLAYGNVNSVDVTALEGFTTQALAKVSPTTTKVKVSGTTNPTSQGTTDCQKLAASTPGVKCPSASGSSNTTTTTAPPVPHVGSTINVAGLNDSSADVTLNQIIDPASGNNEIETPDAGKRFVAAAMTIKNTSSANLSGDANIDATLIGSDGQTYTPTVATVAECTNFNYGDFQLAPGESASGCVPFEIPTGVTVTAFKFSQDLGISGTFGEWMVP